MRHNASVFGSNFKYILALTALAWITYTMPSVRAAFETSYAPQDGYAAVSASAPASAFGLLPSIKLIGTFENQVSATKLNIKVGDTFFVYGSPQNTKNLKVGKDYDATFVYGKSHINCSQTNLSINSVWILACKANKSGEGKVYMKITRGSLSQISNPIVFYVASDSSQPENPTVSVVSTQSDVVVGELSNDDVGIFTIKYKVTNNTGSDAYIPNFLMYSLEKSGSIVSLSGTNVVSSVTSDSLEDPSSNNSWLVGDGETETFTLTVSVPMGGSLTTGQYRVSLDKIPWANQDGLGFARFITDVLPIKTSYEYLN